jgi:hypothetical protein
VVAAPGEPELDWSNFWPTLLHDATKQASPTIAIIRFIFQLTLFGELKKQAASTLIRAASQEKAVVGGQGPVVSE